MVTPASGASTSTPAARSFSSAPWVAVTSSGDCHSWVATATAAASSAVNSTGGSAYASRLMRYPSVGSSDDTLPVSNGMPRSRSSFLSRSNIRENASSLGLSA